MPRPHQPAIQRVVNFFPRAGDHVRWRHEFTGTGQTAPGQQARARTADKWWKHRCRAKNVLDEWRKWPVVTDGGSCQTAFSCNPNEVRVCRCYPCSVTAESMLAKFALS